MRTIVAVVFVLLAATSIPRCTHDAEAAEKTDPAQSSGEVKPLVEVTAQESRIVYVVQARHDVALRSGEHVRPRVTVECDGVAPRIRLDLNAFRTRAAQAYGEYVYVEEFPEAIEKPRCPPPVDARGRKLEGTVTIQAHVNVDGRVDETRVVRSAPGLDETAIECVRRYRFKPARSKGKPVAVWVAVPIRFRPE